MSDWLGVIVVTIFLVIRETIRELTRNNTESKSNEDESKRG